MANKGRYRLTVQQGPAPGKVYEIAHDVTTIGRDVRNDVVVNDAEVSRTHARLTMQADGYLVEDLASTNGTFLNGQRLRAPQPLRPGDMLGLGETVVLVFEPVAEPEETWAGPQPAPAEAAPATAEAAAAAPETRSQLLRWAAIGCGCLTVLVVLGGLTALGIFLWNAPLEFWQSLPGFN